MKNFIKTVMAVSILAASVGASASAGSYDAAKDIRDRLDAVYHNFGANFAINDNDTGDNPHGYVRGGESVKEFGELLYLIDLDYDAVVTEDAGGIQVGINSGGYIYTDSSDITLGDVDVISQEATEAEILAQVTVFTDAVEQDLFGTQGSAPEGSLYDISQNGPGGTAQGEGTAGAGGIAGQAVERVVDAVVATNVTLAGSIDATLGQVAINDFHTNTASDIANFNGAVAALGDVSSSLTADGYADYEFNATFSGGTFTAANGFSSVNFAAAPSELGLMDNPGDIYTAFLTTAALDGASGADGVGGADQVHGGIGYTTTVINNQDGSVTQIKTYDQGRTITTIFYADGTESDPVDSQDQGG